MNSAEQNDQAHYLYLMLLRSALFLTCLLALTVHQTQGQIGNYSVQLDVASPGGIHNTMVYFEDSLTWTTDVPTYGWDACCDALFIPGSTPVSFLYTEIIEPVFPVNNQISINGMPPLTGSYSVPVNLLVGTTGSHTIVATSDQIPSGMTVELQDLDLGVIQDLLDSSFYFFDASVGDEVDRFILHFNMNLVAIESHEKTEWKVFPTLAEDVIRVTGTGNRFPLQAEVITVDGRLISDLRLNSGKATIDIHDLIPGLYFLRLSMADRKETFRFIKK